MGGQVHSDGKEGVGRGQDHPRLSGTAHDERGAAGREQNNTGTSFPLRFTDARYFTGDFGCEFKSLVNQRAIFSHLSETFNHQLDACTGLTCKSLWTKMNKCKCNVNAMWSFFRLASRTASTALQLCMLRNLHLMNDCKTSVIRERERLLK